MGRGLQTLPLSIFEEFYMDKAFQEFGTFIQIQQRLRKAHNGPIAHFEQYDKALAEAEEKFTAIAEEKLEEVLLEA